MIGSNVHNDLSRIGEEIVMTGKPLPAFWAIQIAAELSLPNVWLVEDN